MSKPKGFVKYPMTLCEALRDGAIAETELRVCAALAARAWNGASTVRITYKKLSEDTGIHQRNLGPALIKLAAQGCIRYTRQVQEKKKGESQENEQGVQRKKATYTLNQEQFVRVPRELNQKVIRGDLKIFTIRLYLILCMQNLATRKAAGSIRSLARGARTSHGAFYAALAALLDLGVVVETSERDEETKKRLRGRSALCMFEMPIELHVDVTPAPKKAEDTGEDFDLGAWLAENVGQVDQVAGALPGLKRPAVGERAGIEQMQYYDTRVKEVARRRGVNIADVEADLAGLERLRELGYDPRNRDEWTREQVFEAIKVLGTWLE